MTIWKLVDKNTLEDGYMVSLSAVDNEYEDSEVQFKWDGCINYTEYLNGFRVDDPDSEEKRENSQYIHICDINRAIEKLQEIKKLAEENFSKQDYDEYWN